MTEITINSTTNGFIVVEKQERNDHDLHQHDRVIAVARPFSFETFDNMAAHLRMRFRSGRLGDYGRLYMGDKEVSPEQSVEEMRDELGELRRFKERALKRDVEQADQIKKLVDQAADYKASRDRTYTDNRNLEIERDDLAAKLAVFEKRAKRRRRRY